MHTTTKTTYRVTVAKYASARAEHYTYVSREFALKQADALKLAYPGRTITVTEKVVTTTTELIHTAR